MEKYFKTRQEAEQFRLENTNFENKRVYLKVDNSNWYDTGNILTVNNDKGYFVKCMGNSAQGSSSLRLEEVLSNYSL